MLEAAFFFKLSYLFIYFSKRNALCIDQYIKRLQGTTPNQCLQLFKILFTLEHL